MVRLKWDCRLSTLWHFVKRFGRIYLKSLVGWTICCNKWFYHSNGWFNTMHLCSASEAAPVEVYSDVVNTSSWWCNSHEWNKCKINCMFSLHVKVNCTNNNGLVWWTGLPNITTNRCTAVAVFATLQHLKWLVSTSNGLKTNRSLPTVSSNYSIDNCSIYSTAFQVPVFLKGMTHGIDM